MMKLRFAVLLAAAALALPGCLLLAGAAIGAGIVHVVGSDSAEVVLEKDRAKVFEAAREEVKTRGVVETADAEAGTISGRVGSSSVEIAVAKETDSTVKVTVESRKNSGISPDPDTAQQVATAIVKRTE